MNEKEQLLETVSNEIDKLYEEENQEVEEDKQKHLIMAMIIDHIDRNYDNDEEELIKEFSALAEPLKTLCDIFYEYIDMDRVLEKVFKDYFLKGQSHRTIVEDCMFCDEFYQDDFCDDEEFDEEDEGLIHDNEDC